MHNKKIAIGLLALLFAQPIFAANTASKPTTCPSINAIQSLGLITASAGGPYGWTVMSAKNHYGTAEEWRFVLFGVFASTEKIALSLGNAILPLLSLTSGPLEEHDGDKIWLCHYALSANDETYLGFAVTPPPSDPVSALAASLAV